MQVGLITSTNNPEKVINFLGSSFGSINFFPPSRPMDLECDLGHILHLADFRWGLAKNLGTLNNMMTEVGCFLNYEARELLL